MSTVAALTVLEMGLRGYDGSLWELLRGEQGVWLGEGLAGLHLPTFKQQEEKSARRPGRRYRGTSYDARKLDLKLHVGDIDSERIGWQWRELDDAFWASVSPEYLSRFYVVTETGGYRWVDCRLDAVPDPAYGENPAKFGHATYQPTLTADSPWWQGFPETATFTPDASASRAYYGPYPLDYSASSTLTGTTVRNPGDLEAWPVWFLTGPGVWTVGVGTHRTVFPLMASGEQRIVDTDPMILTNVDGTGQNRWPSMGVHDFTQAVAPGQADLSVSVAGNGPGSQATVVLTPQYRRAW